MGHGYNWPPNVEPIFLDEKVKGYLLSGETWRLDTIFYPIGFDPVIFDEDEEDGGWTFNPRVILEYRILEAISERQVKKPSVKYREVPITVEQYLESERERIERNKKELEQRLGIKPLKTEPDPYRKMKLDEIPNKETILEYIEKSISDEKEHFCFYVDAQMYFNFDFSQKPVDEFELRKWNKYKELADIYGYSCEKSNRKFIRKHNAAKQLCIAHKYDELNMSIHDYRDTLDTEESPEDGYFCDSFYELFSDISTLNLDFHPSKEVFLSGLIDLGKMSYEWDYGRNSHPDLIKKVSEFCNEFCNEKNNPYTPLNGFLLSMVKDLGEDLLDKGAAKECGYCGGIFPFRTNKLYCSPVSEGRDCGKKARNQRYYIKKSLENPTEN